MVADLLMDYPDLIHHFSWSTRISIELPIGFEEQADDPEGHRAMYADDLDATDELGGRVMTSVVALANDDEGAARMMADQSAEMPGRHLEQRREAVINHLPGLVQLLTYYEPELETDLVRHETYVQAGNVLFTIIALAPGKRGREYLPAFEHASSTARFILV